MARNANEPLPNVYRRLEFQEIAGLRYTHIPLRLTQEEWEHLCDPWGGNTGMLEDLVHHPLFTISAYVAWYEGWDYCDVYEIALHYRRFGPHKTRGLAKRKALAFLTQRRCIEVITTPKSCTTVVQ